MKKLIHGIVDFRKKSLTDYRDKFSKLAFGQAPDTLFIACCDSRVVPNTFASTDPGDLFVLRNIGNLICPYHPADKRNVDESTAGAIEFSVNILNVKDIIICGHSECAAMQAIINGRGKIDLPQLRAWLRHGESSYAKLQSGFRLNKNLTLHNELSQVNVLQQLEHLKTFPCVIEKLKNKSLQIHGWWFDLATADVYHYDIDKNNFVVIDEKWVSENSGKLK